MISGAVNRYKFYKSSTERLGEQSDNVVQEQGLSNGVQLLCLEDTCMWSRSVTT